MEELVLGQYLNSKILYKYADFKQLGNFSVFQKNCYKVMAFSSDKI